MKEEERCGAEAEGRSDDEEEKDRAIEEEEIG